MKTFAVFVVVKKGDFFAATTRAVDRGESGKVGFPGGKVDPGESLFDAALRESKEEGWEIIGLNKKPFYSQIVEGKLVAWFKASKVSKLNLFKEKGRIKPVLVSSIELIDSGYGNDKALNHYD